MELNKSRVGFVIDIDGTLVKSGQPLPGAKQSLELLTARGIPFLLLTNNVAKSQAIKAKQVSSMLQLETPLNEKQVVLNYTPIKQNFKQFKNEIVLIVGREQRLQEILPLPQMQRYITVHEYCTIFPEAVPMAERRTQSYQKDVCQRVLKRLNLTTLDKHQLKISGVIILTAPINWDQAIQIIIDVLSTEQGFLSQNSFYQYQEKHIPVMTCYNDFFHAPLNHNLPRLLMRPFIESLKTVYKLVYSHELKIDIYGKPHSNSFNFAKKQLQSFQGPLDKIVMIGDNLEADIIGPLELGWDTILVLTGVHSQHHPPSTINADNILDGVRQYLKIPHQ